MNTSDTTIYMSDTILNNNALAFIGLCNEYRVAAESAAETDRQEFVDTMLRLLPRIYIAASDLTIGSISEDAYIAPVLDEDYYESIRRAIENLMGPDDTYLEVFEEDMKYSDTPIAASISEGLTDIFQSVYNFIEMIKPDPATLAPDALAAMKEDFESYWSQILCNNIRALNKLKYSSSEID